MDNVWGATNENYFLSCHDGRCYVELYPRLAPDYVVSADSTELVPNHYSDDNSGDSLRRRGLGVGYTIWNQIFMDGLYLVNT